MCNAGCSMKSRSPHRLHRLKNVCKRFNTYKSWCRSKAASMSTLNALPVWWKFFTHTGDSVAGLWLVYRQICVLDGCTGGSSPFWQQNCKQSGLSANIRACLWTWFGQDILHECEVQSSLVLCCCFFFPPLVDFFLLLLGLTGPGMSSCCCLLASSSSCRVKKFLYSTWRWSLTHKQHTSLYVVTMTYWFKPQNNVE